VSRYDNGYSELDANGNLTTESQRRQHKDSLGTDKEIPKGIYGWTIDKRFGDIRPAQMDTLSHMFMNSIFTEGKRGEYNTTGNLGSPRQARIFIDRNTDGQFIFTQPYDFAVQPEDQFIFTNTLSPFTNLTYNNSGNSTNGEDHFTAKFGVNAGRRLGVGFKFDYIYGRGYYSNQSTSHFNYTMYGSYLGDRYQAHLLASTNHQKVTENGGITSDMYITHPETFNESYSEEEIPTMLQRNWNRNDNQHIFFSQRYIVGFNRKVPMTPKEIEAKKFAMAAKKDAEERKRKEQAAKDAREAGREVDEKALAPTPTIAGRPDNAKIAEGTMRSDSTAKARITVNGKAAADSLLAASAKTQEDTSWLKNEYVPVTSFIHTLHLNNYRRIYEAYDTPTNFYLDNYTVQEKLGNDSIYDKTTHWQLSNTFAISMLEGFNKWAKFGLKAFATHELRHFTLPDETGVRTWNENALSVGGQLSKTQGNTLHFNAVGEVGVAGINAGELHLNGGVDLNFPLFGDTITLAASGFYAHEKPSFYYRHYQSRHYWWDNDDLSMTDHLRVQGVLNYQKTRTQLRVAFDEIKNYTYFATSYSAGDETRTNNSTTVKQESGGVTVLTAELSQDLTWGPLNWESVVTYQHSTNQEVLPLPKLNVYTNLYLRFKIAHVLKCDFGADARYFTKYNAPEYVPGIGQYAVQANDTKVEIGNYPLVNVYANFHLKQTRFFVMMSHVNEGRGSKNYFYAPHYPLNGSIFRFGLSWNFYN
jgi:hypothetical protein